MTKQELIFNVSQEITNKARYKTDDEKNKTVDLTVASKTEKMVANVIDLTVENIINALVNGEKVLISGFGSFEVRIRKARKCKNPKTGDDITYPVKKTPAFVSGKPLKDAVNHK
jgi:DNA-binding protein HU-beta